MDGMKQHRTANLRFFGTWLNDGTAELTVLCEECKHYGSFSSTTSLIDIELELNKVSCAVRKPKPTMSDFCITTDRDSYIYVGCVHCYWEVATYVSSERNLYTLKEIFNFVMVQHAECDKRGT